MRLSKPIKRVASVGLFSLASALASTLTLVSALEAQSTFVPVIENVEGHQVRPFDAVSNTSTTSSSFWSVGVNPEVTALARSLSRDPERSSDLIYQYVLNTVETLPQYGLKKGSTGVIIDKKGTPFDQAALMVDLLHAAGNANARIHLVMMELDFTEANAWLGVDNAVDTCRLLSAGGIPFEFNNATTINDCNTVSGAARVKILHPVVENAGRFYNPSYKIQNQIDGIDLGSAMGFDLTALQTAGTFTHGTTPNQVPYITGTAVPGNVEAVLQTNAEALQHYLQEDTLEDGASEDRYLWSTADVIGGVEIAPLGNNDLEASNLGSSSLTSLDNVITSMGVSFTEVPDQYRTRVRINYSYHVPLTSESDNDFLAFMDELYGRRLCFERDGSNVVLNASNREVWSQDYDVSDNIKITLEHPSGLTRTESFRPNFNQGATALVLSSGYTSIGYSGHLLDDTYQALNVDESLPAIGDSRLAVAQIMVGGNYLSQQSQFIKMMDGVTDTRTLVHDVVGLVSGDDGGDMIQPRLDIRGQVSVLAKGATQTVRANSEQAAYTTLAAGMNVLEASIIDQLLDTKIDEDKTPSVVSLMSDGLLEGNKIYDVEQDTITSLTGILQGYMYQSGNISSRLGIRPDTSNLVQSSYSQTHNLVLKDAPGSTSLAPAPLIAIDPVTGAIGYLMENSRSNVYIPHKGAFANEMMDAEGVMKTSTMAIIDTVGLNSSVIPQATGAGFSGTELIAGSGEFPYALPFTRSLSPGTSAAGGGWSHNYDMDARFTAGSMIGLGMRRPVEATKTISALYGTFKYLEACIAANSCALNEQVMMAAVGMNWMQDGLIDNVFSLRTAHTTAAYARLADGTYEGPGGEKVEFDVQSRGRYIDITTMDGVVTHLDDIDHSRRQYNVQRIDWPSGMYVTFVNSGTYTRVQNAFGAQLTIYRDNPSGSNRYGDLSASSYYNGTSTGDIRIRQAYSSEGPYLEVKRNDVETARYYLDEDTGRITHIYTPEVAERATFTYNTMGQTESTTVPDRGTTTSYANDWRSESVGPDGSVSMGITDPYGRYSVSIDALGNRSRADYDRRGRTVRTEGIKDEFGDYVYQTTDYDKYHRVLSTTAYSKPRADGTREERTTSFTYYGADKYYQLASTTDPVGRVTTLDYYPNTATPETGRGLLSSTTAPAVTLHDGSMQNPITSYTYQRYGLLTTTTAPDGTVSRIDRYKSGTSLPEYVYADHGGLNLRTRYYYHANGQLNYVDTPKRSETHTRRDYDAQNRVEYVYQGSSHSSSPGVTRYIYDGNGRLSQTTFFCTTSCSGSTRFNARTTTRTYDDAGRLNSVRDHAGNTSRVDYDDANRIITVTNPRGRQQARHFDELGRHIMTVYNAGAEDPNDRIVERMAYKVDGTLDYVEDGRETKTLYEYDHWNRLVKTDFFAGGDATIEAYDVAGRPTRTRNRGGDITEITYNDLDWVLTRTVTQFDGDITSYSFTYDIMGRVQTVTHTGTGMPTASVSYTYDSLGRKLSETGAHGMTTAYEYDDRLGTTTLKYDVAGTYSVTYATDRYGRPSTIKKGSSTIATYRYDNQNRVDRITFGNGAKQEVTYDEDTSWVESLTLDAAGTASDVEFAYGRDARGRIRTETISNQGYVFKAHDLAEPLISYTANQINQYTEIEGNERVAYSYDSNGNLTHDGTFNYAYNAENQLKEAHRVISANPGGDDVTMLVGEYKYDALGRRSEKTAHSTGTITTRYQYNGDTVLAEYNELNIVQRRYIYGPGTDNPLMVEEADGTQRYLHRDGRGNIIAASNETGTVTEKFTTDIWGYGATEATSPYKYTARRVDQETGNYYYRARYYHPGTGRFMSNDPIGYGDGLNMYAYVKNDPVNYNDPTGLRLSCFACQLVQDVGGGTASGGGVEGRSGGGGGPQGAPITPPNVIPDPRPCSAGLAGCYIVNGSAVSGGNGGGLGTTVSIGGRSPIPSLALPGQHFIPGEFEGSGPDEDEDENRKIFILADGFSLADIDGTCTLENTNVRIGFKRDQGDIGSGLNSIVIGIEIARTSLPLIAKPGGISGGGRIGPRTSKFSLLSRQVFGEERAPKARFGTTSRGGIVTRGFTPAINGLSLINIISGAIRFNEEEEARNNAPICVPDPV